MKINLVTYLPSGQQSNTLKLLKHMQSHLEGKHEIDHVDLLANPPKHFNELAMGAYWMRNFGGQDINADMTAAIAPMDELTARLKAADILILCHPMHNFSYPGPVKVWIDAIMQFGQCFTFTETGPQGLLTDMKSLTVYTSYGDYSPGGGREWQNTIPSLAKIEFEYLGMNDIRTIGASVGDQEQIEANLDKAKAEIDQTFKDWRLIA